MRMLVNERITVILSYTSIKYSTSILLPHRDHPVTIATKIRRKFVRHSFPSRDDNQWEMVTGWKRMLDEIRTWCSRYGHGGVTQLKEVL